MTELISHETFSLIYAATIITVPFWIQILAPSKQILFVLSGCILAVIGWSAFQLLQNKEMTAVGAGLWILLLFFCTLSWILGLALRWFLLKRKSARQNAPPQE